MEQLVQSLKEGNMVLAEVPFPALNEGCILVRNHYSLISSGTEGKTVKDARMGYVGKAMARKDEVKKVIKTARTTGIMNTYRLVMNKLESPQPLGYCCAGEVIEVAHGITDIKVGDFVACGGATANHAEVVSIPRNLCAKVPENVTAEEACMTTMGAIAMQGIRQADLRLGENCVVIGLGLLGQMTMQLLSASGIKTIGIDIDAVQVQKTIENGMNAINRNNEYLLHAIQEMSGGFGTDAVIITAGSSSTDPINLSGEICRQKGKVVIVGAVPAGFERPNFFKKELELKMSCSYGPGRYDNNYEEKGIDYPIGYVRWTENRNMQAFLELIHERKINPAQLISHRFNFNDCISAYDLVVDKSQSTLGIILKYDVAKPISKRVDFVSTTNEQKVSIEPVVGFIGAGNFAKNILIPAFADVAQLGGIATSKPHDATNAAKKSGFGYCTGDANELFEDKKINTIVIATRHDSHFKYVMKALESGKNVFVEKPLCLNEGELEELKTKVLSSGKNLMTGFNRRFSPLTKELKLKIDELENTPVSINYRINAGIVPASHWVHDPQIGGGRIIGEVCHFIDLAMFLARSPIQSVSAVDMKDVNNFDDTVAINLSFKNGSIANISYFSNGHTAVKKEFLEVFFTGRVGVIDDFASLKISGKQNINLKINGQDKGHKNQVAAFVESLKKGETPPISFEDQYVSMLATFKVIESIKLQGERIFL